jgi:hypothetical protein
MQLKRQTHSWVVDSWNTLKDTIAGRITPLNYRNPSNTNVVYWGGKVLSLYETGLPYALDPRTLHTLGPDNLGGALKLGAMAAHFRYDSVKDSRADRDLPQTADAIASKELAIEQLAQCR